MIVFQQKLTKVQVDTVGTAVGMAFFQLTNFLLGIFIVRMLGGTELGNYQYFIATTTLLSYFAKMGFDEKLSYILPTIGGANSEQGNKLISNTLLQTLIYSCVILFFYCVFLVFFSSGNDSNTLLVEVFAYVLYFPSFVGGLILLSVLRAENKMLQRSFFVYLVPNIINFIFIVTLVFFASISNIAPLARALSYFFIFIVLLFLIYSHYGLKLPEKLKFEKPKEFNWLFLTSLCFIVESGVLAIWLGKSYLVDSEFGVLAVLLRLSALVLLIPVAISLVLGPLLAKNPLNQNIRNKMLKTNFCGVLLVLIFICFFAKYLLIFFGQEYVGSEWQLLKLSFAMGVLAWSQPINSIFIAFKKYHYIIFAALVSLTAFLGVISYEDNINLSSLLTALILSIMVFSFIKLLLLKVLFIKSNNLND